MKRLEQVVAKTAKNFTDRSVNQWTCGLIFYQPKVTEQLKKRLKEIKN